MNRTIKWPVFLAIILLLAVFNGSSYAYTVLHTINSPEPDSDVAQFGYSNNIVDLDNDNIPDYVIGALSQDCGGVESCGRVYVISGADGQSIILSIDNPSPTPFNSQFGSDIEVYQDFNSGGKADILVGASRELVGSIRTGRAYLMSGEDGTTQLAVYNDPNPTDGGGFGSRIEVLGDIDGDDYWDVAISAPGAVNSTDGRVIVFSGLTGVPIYTVNDPSIGSSGFFGEWMKKVGDLNGDSVSELVISDRLYDGPGLKDSGRAYVIDGATGSIIWTLESPDPQTSGYFGLSVSRAGDQDGDGTYDILVGEIGASRAYVFSGFTGDRLITIDGPQADSSFGHHVGAIADMTADGYPELIVGAVSYTDAYPEQGQVNIYSGLDGTHLLAINDPNPGSFGGFGLRITTWAALGKGTNNWYLMVSTHWKDFGSFNQSGEVTVIEFSDSDGDFIADDFDDLDTDLDGILDDADNCPNIPNPDQLNSDNDSHGDVCDNSAYVDNEDQNDADNDGIGDVGDVYDISVTDILNTVVPGAPRFATFSLTYNKITPTDADACRQLVKLNCFNTTFPIEKETAPGTEVWEEIPHLNRLGIWSVLPVDLVKLCSNPDLGPTVQSVTCDVTDNYPVGAISAGTGGIAANYRIKGHYESFKVDRYWDPATNTCSDEDGDCFGTIEIGMWESVANTFVVAGTPVNTLPAVIGLEPGTWAVEWGSEMAPPITASISGIPADSVDTSTIRINGESGIIPGSAVVVDSDTLTVQFDGSDAINAVRRTGEGRVYPKVTGQLTDSGDYFSGTGTAYLEKAVQLSIDIKPGSDTNPINLGSNGGIPVQIFSLDANGNGYLDAGDMDATTIVPETVNLAGAGVRVKGKGSRYMMNTGDYNDDGLTDLQINVDTTALGLAEGAQEAVLWGQTTAGTWIIGRDIITIVP